jgi:CBS-domain-containing membrane protein
MKCIEIMKTDISCVSGETSIQAAARKMRDQNIGFLPVCDETMRVSGTITDRDLAIRGVAEGRAPGTPVRALMSIDVIACRPEDPLSYARDLMAQHHKSRIMCLDREGRVAGVISLSDIAQQDEISAVDTLRQVSSREARGSTTLLA